MPQKHRSRFYLGAIAGVLLSGCGGAPQFSADNRELLKPLHTAVSAKKLEWVTATEEKINARKEAGSLSDAELAAMNGVIENARAGNWDAAQSAVIALIDGQRATSEDVANLEKKKSRPEHRHTPRR
jgi:hypothetical protein